MTWTNKIPTVPGFYWCRMHNIEFVTEIRIEEGKAVSCGYYHERMSVFGTTGSWAGPIPLPTGNC
ncbi:hypothetical protein LCGC14_1347790 [marine sediment metagenome]|uniref:Uncharacterized protein n=1 Tax=marine sediment metagenome TaxID=412755 RepID=A0A0F9MSJ5_9ZZZZ